MEDQLFPFELSVVMFVLLSHCLCSLMLKQLNPIDSSRILDGGGWAVSGYYALLSRCKWMALHEFVAMSRVSFPWFCFDPSEARVGPELHHFPFLFCMPTLLWVPDSFWCLFPSLSCIFWPWPKGSPCWLEQALSCKIWGWTLSIQYLFAWFQFGASCIMWINKFLISSHTIFSLLISKCLQYWN